jgi:hypothetical protein
LCEKKQQKKMENEDNESYATAEEDETHVVGSPNISNTIIDYDLSPGVACIDCFIEIAVTPKEFLLGQRAISATQIAREGKNIRVVSHIRQDVHRVSV